MAVGSLLHATLVSLQYCYQVYRELVCWTEYILGTANGLHEFIFKVIKLMRIRLIHRSLPFTVLTSAYILLNSGG